MHMDFHSVKAASMALLQQKLHIGMRLDDAVYLPPLNSRFRVVSDGQLGSARPSQAAKQPMWLYESELVLSVASCIVTLRAINPVTWHGHPQQPEALDLLADRSTCIGYLYCRPSYQHT